MKVSEFSGSGYSTGYVCDKCCGRSSRGLNRGIRERWYCHECKSDFCFLCVPKERSSVHSTTSSPAEQHTQEDITLLSALAAMDAALAEIEDWCERWSEDEVWRQRRRQLTLSLRAQSESGVTQPPPMLRTRSEAERAEESALTLHALYERRMRRHQFACM